MLQETRSTDAEYVEFLAAGMHATGQFHCSECGYGITIHTELPRCPMCSGESWEQSAWSPMSRALQDA